MLLDNVSRSNAALLTAPLVLLLCDELTCDQPCDTKNFTCARAGNNVHGDRYFPGHVNESISNDR